VDRVAVVVKEGTVEVGPPASQKPSEAPNGSAPMGWQPDRITEGQALSYDVTGKIARLPDVDVDDVGSWVEGRLEYRHTPLQIVIPRVSRYNAKPIVVTDDVAGTLPFSGLIFVGQIESFLQALQAAYPVEIIERTDRLEIRSRIAALRSDH
jgi:ferric-dicitrate binding protein FerR (iron transport regulator)